MDVLLIQLVFLSLFHILGGGGLGVALRGIRGAPLLTGIRENLNLIIWALLFGGLPLVMGLANPVLLFIQILELVGACLVTLFFWDRIRELLGSANVLLILIGGIFFSAGCGTSGLLLKGGEILTAGLIGLLAGGVGLALIAFGLYRTFSTSDVEDE